MGGRALNILVHAVMAALGVAGLLKVADLQQFARSLEDWVLMPSALRPACVLTVPFLEIFIAASWFFAPWRRWVLVLGLVLLVGFASVYALHVATVGPPQCNCFGLLERFHNFQSSSKWVIGRDVAMCLPLAARVLFERKPAP